MGQRTAEGTRSDKRGGYGRSAGPPQAKFSPLGGQRSTRSDKREGHIYLPSLSQLLDARIKRSRSRLALAAAAASMFAGNRIIQLPSGSTT